MFFFIVLSCVLMFSVCSNQIAQAGLHSLFNVNFSRDKHCQEGLSQEAVKIVEADMKLQIESYFKRMLGDQLEMRWVEAYFPFTHPSWELEINTGDQWMEMLGCGVIEQKILHRDGCADKIGWAFGIGLERLAMLFYSIPDIRLFWTRDTGFTVQFSQLEPFERVAYKPISSYPQKIFDISFWLPEDPERVSNWSVNDVHAIVLEIGGDLVEQVHLVEQWQRPTDGRMSNCFRIVYRSHERALTNTEVNEIHGKIEQALVDLMQVEIR